MEFKLSKEKAYVRQMVKEFERQNEMTYEEAIKYFKMRLAERTHPPTTAQQKAFTVALEALEKQIPKEPYIIVTSDNEYVCTICSECQKVSVEVNDTFCRNCGQALDWGE